MMNDFQKECRKIWFQKDANIEYFKDRIFYIWANDNQEVINTEVKEWDGETILNNDATFIEAIDKDDIILFVYNSTNRMLYIDGKIFGNVKPDKIPELLGNKAYKFFKGKRLEKYREDLYKEEFVKNCFWDGHKRYYIVKFKEYIKTHSGSHNDPSFSSYVKEYILYDGNNLWKLIEDSCLYPERTLITSCKKPDIDALCQRYNVKLG